MVLYGSLWKALFVWLKSFWTKPLCCLGKGLLRIQQRKVCVVLRVRDPFGLGCGENKIFMEVLISLSAAGFLPSVREKGSVGLSQVGQHRVAVAALAAGSEHPWLWAPVPAATSRHSVQPTCPALEPQQVFSVFS